MSDPEEPGDSEDLTEAEVSEAKVPEKPGAFLNLSEKCSCGLAGYPCEYARRRRNGQMFCRVKYQCDQGHVRTVLFRASDGDAE